MFIIWEAAKYQKTTKKHRYKKLWNLTKSDQRVRHWVYYLVLVQCKFIWFFLVFEPNVSIEKTLQNDENTFKFSLMALWFVLTHNNIIIEALIVLSFCCHIVIIRHFLIKHSISWKFSYLLGFELFPCDLLSLELPREVPREPSFFESVSLARSSISLHITSSHSSWSSSSRISATKREIQKRIN